jgi:hypothetical protein
MEAAENLMLFSMVTHYQSVHHGEYPSRPLAGQVPEGIPVRHQPHQPLFNFQGNKINVNNDFALDAIALQPLPEAAMYSKGEAVQTFDVTTAKFAAETDLPEAYQSSLRL